ncbi:MFS transporter [Jiangella mangrovi]|uniref:MFS family permease n=1 Tax=Jiangella mangrovi TaxID=1524084 RepID=A0A7W9LJR4_9ACTN|nr:MFS transporter [Jiangella mangrovi]MBB5786299.1 MFS family permease [Jiangella mangrovi]
MSTHTDLQPAPPAPRFTAAERLALAVLLTANFTLAVDFSILNVALPRIGQDLGLATGHLQWIVTSFALCAAGGTLFFGRVADVFGRRRLFLAGIALLGAASAAGALAQEPALLIVARVAQGVATAMVTPAALSLLTTLFPEGTARTRVLGLNGALMAAGFTTGAVLGGVLTGAVSWRWAFYVNVAVAVVVLAAGPFVLSGGTAGRRPRLDAPGAVLVTLALVAVAYGISTAGESGWTHPAAWGVLLAAAVLLVAFWQVENRVREPLVAPSILRRHNVSWGAVAGLLAFATETALVFLLTLYLQDVLGFGAVAAGLALAVLGVGTVVGGLAAPRVIGRTGAKWAMVAGFVVQATATLPLAFAGGSSAWVVPLLVLTFAGGVANLVVIVGYAVTTTAGVPAGQQGLATGLVTLSQQVGITLGTPLLSAVLAGRLADGLLPALRLAIGVDAALCLAAAALVAVTVRTAGGPGRPASSAPARSSSR